MHDLAPFAQPGGPDKEAESCEENGEDGKPPEKESEGLRVGKAESGADETGTPEHDEYSGHEAGPGAEFFSPDRFDHQGACSVESGPVIFECRGSAKGGELFPCPRARAVGCSAQKNNDDGFCLKGFRRMLLFRIFELFHGRVFVPVIDDFSSRQLYFPRRRFRHHLI